MESHERNLFISLCLGIRLDGTESKSQLDELLRNLAIVAWNCEVQPLQDDLADWLDVSIARCKNQQDASLRLWNKIDEEGYSLVDVPMKIRRQAFGGTVDIQKRFGKRPWYARLTSKLLSLAKIITTVTILAGVTWIAYKILSE